jgi:hypothetical protein
MNQANVMPSARSAGLSFFPASSTFTVGAVGPAMTKTYLLPAQGHCEDPARAPSIPARALSRRTRRGDHDGARNGTDRSSERDGPCARGVYPRPVAAAKLLGAMDNDPRGGRLRGGDARMAGRSGDGRGGESAPRGLRPQEDRADRRPVRRDNRQAVDEAGDYRSFLRRAAHHDHGGTWTLLGVGGHQSRALPRRAARSDCGPQGVLAGSSQPGQP